MPIFWFLVLLALVALWFLLAFAYKAIGRFFKQIFKDSYDAMMSEDPKDISITNENDGGKEE